jgi:hypothetical protein
MTEMFEGFCRRSARASRAEQAILGLLIAVSVGTIFYVTAFDAHGSRWKIRDRDGQAPLVDQRTRFPRIG